MKKVICSTNSSLLSVFWCIDGKFIGADGTLDGDNVMPYGDYLQVDTDHFIIWDKIAKRFGYTQDYTYYPRGRVMFNTKLHKFVVIADKKISDDPTVQSALCDHYGLDKRAVIFETDEHYSSYQD